MADQKPIKGIYNVGDSIGLGEFTATDTVGIVDGGTGAATASQARINLGLDIGVDVQAYDATILNSSSSIKDLSDVFSSMTPTDGQVLTYDTINGWQSETPAAAGISNVVEDTTPQLGGELDVNGNAIVSVTNGDITITPNGTGKTKTTNLEAAIPLNAQTGTTYTPVLADADKMITLNNAAAVTVTIPANASVAYPVGTKLNFMQLGAGAVTIGITTDTLSFDSSLTATLNGQYAVATAIKVAATQWVLFGNLTPA